MDCTSWTKSVVHSVTGFLRRFGRRDQHRLKNMGKYMELVQDFIRTFSETVWIQSLRRCFATHMMVLPSVGWFLLRVHGLSLRFGDSNLVCWRLTLTLQPNLNGLDVAMIHCKCPVIVVNLSSLLKSLWNPSLTRQRPFLKDPKSAL